MELRRIREAIVVEGRDDVAAVSRACDALLIATHGFGIREETWSLIDKAYREKGLIVLTDPDFAGEEIRRRIAARCPEARHAFLPRREAERQGDIGVENASPEAIALAIDKAQATTVLAPNDAVTADDLRELRLTGCREAAARRADVGAELGIGYGNGKAFLGKLKAFGITREELTKAVETIGKKTQ